MLDNQVARAVERHEMLKTERATYLRWPSQEAVGASASPDGKNEEVTSDEGDPLAGSDASDSHQRRSSGSSFEESDSDVELTYICPCNRRFTRPAAYQRHLDVAHSNAECHKCAVCNKTFGNERTLTMHMSVHQDSKQFTSTLERCSSKNKHSTKSHKIHTSIYKQVEKNSKSAACAGKLSIDSAHSNISINLVGATKVNSDDKTTSSRDASSAQNGNTSSDEDGVGTDKENFSPGHTPSGSPVDSSDTLSTDSVNVPPLVNGKSHANSSLDLDLTLPKSKSSNLDENTVVVSNDTKIISQSSFVARCAERSSSTAEPNKVSVITIKTDRSLLSESVLLQSKGGKVGEYTVNPARHSVIVIKTQENKNKFIPINKKAGLPNSTSSEEKSVTELDSVRKSQRLRGKVPGWKHILVEKDDISSAEGRGKRRKMSKIKIEEEIANNMLAMANSVQTESYQHLAEMVVKREVEVTEQDYKRPRVSSPDSACPGMVKSGIFKCPVCEKAFESEKYLSMHMSLHKVDNSMQSLMSKNNKEEELENNNINLNIKSGNITSNGSFWTCKICNKVFAQNSNYKNHIRTHSDERPFVCQICSIGFKERYHLKKHMLFKHSDELKEECRFCGKKFKDSTAVRAHERIHSDVRPYSCRRCSKSFKTSECLWHHENRSKTCGQALLGMPAPSPRFKRGRQSKKEVKVEKNATPGITVIPMTSNGQHLIQGTPLVLSGSQHVLQTQAVVPPPISYSEVAAAAASIQSPRLPDLVTTTAVQPAPLVKYQPPPTVAPTVVPATTPSTQNTATTYVTPASTPVATSAYYTQPRAIPANTMVNYTPVLVKVEPESALPDYELTAMASSNGSFEDSNSAEVLMKDDPDMPSVTMIENETGLADISHETMMQVQEEIQKDPVLEDIGMLLLEKSDDHEELSMEEDDELLEDDYEEYDLEEILSDSTTHTDKSTDDRFDCDKCGKQFASPTAFDKHLLTHSGLRPYVCNMCGVGFKLKVHLKKHCLYRHSDEKPCECRICGKKFKDSSAVRLHERIHSDDRPFHCECGKTFKTRENLWGHRHRGPCDKKPRLSPEAPAGSAVSYVSSSAISSHPDSMNKAPLYAHAQLGDTRLSAHAAISDNQIIARAIVSNKHMTAEATIGNDGQVKASASISGPHGTAKAQLDTQENSATANVEPAIAMGHQPALPISSMNSRSEAVTVPFPRATESRVSLPVMCAGTPGSGVPTAVVAPLKRETIVTTATGPVISPSSILKPIKILPPEAAPQTDNVPVEVAKPQHEEETEKSEATLPPFETFSPKLRGRAPSLADRCPTIQKYLQMNRQPIKLPGIQQLFQTHSLAQNPSTPNGFPVNGVTQDSTNTAPLIRADPTAPLGPHPAQATTGVVQDLSMDKSAQTPVPTPSPHPVAAVSPHPPISGQQVFIKTAARPPNTLVVPSSGDTLTLPNGYVISKKAVPVAQMIRATSPYLGGYGSQGLPLLLQSDPNLASTSGPGVAVQSPAEPPVTTATTPVYWDEDGEKKTGAAVVWQTEHEQLFQDLTQTTAFGQL